MMYLFVCNSCHIEKWLNSRQARAGKRLFCSRNCVNRGRLHSIEWKNKMSNMMMGEGNPFYGKKHTALSKELMSKNVKIGLQSMTPAAKEKMNYGKRRSVGFQGKKHSIASKRQMSLTRSLKIANGEIPTHPRYIAGTYKSTKTNEQNRFDSFYEYLRMKILDIDDNVSAWTKNHGICIPYKLGDTEHHYVPDFLIQQLDGKTVLEEVKGYEKHNKLMAKKGAAERYTTEINILYRILMHDDLQKLSYSFFDKSIQSLRRQYKNESK